MTEQTNHEDLSAYLDGELDAQMREAVENRLSVDPDYARAFDDLKRTNAMLDAYIEPAPFHATLMQSTAEDTIQQSSPSRLTPKWLAVAAALILLIGTAAYLTWRGSPLPPTENQAPVIVSEPEDDVSPGETQFEVAQDPGEETGQTTSQPDEGAMAATELPLVLGGTVLGETPTAILENSETGERRTVQIGQEIISGVSVVSIEKGQVIIDNEGTFEIIVPDSTVEETQGSIDGEWMFMAIIGENEQESGNVIISESFGALTMRVPGEEQVVARGTRRGKLVEITFMPDSHENSQFSGELNDDLTELTMTGNVPAAEGAVGPEMHVRLTRMNEEMRLGQEALQARMHVLQADLRQMYQVLEAYANRHINRFPSSVDQLGAQDAELFKSSNDRHVTYTPGLERPDISGGAPELADIDPGLPMPDRLVQLERMCKYFMRGWYPFPVDLVRVTYVSDAIEGTVDVEGSVRIRVPSKRRALAAETEEVKRARLAAQVASSQNNMKQLGIVIKMFENEHDGYGPGGWFTVYPEYLTDPNVLDSPLDEKREIGYELVWPATHLQDFGRNILGTPPNERVPLEVIPMAIEGPQHINSSGNLARNVLFADGHVQSFEQSEWDDRIEPYLKLR
jgi:prepilin-type processing-associated H-X9-DG protein